MFTDEELEGAILRYLTGDVDTARTAAGTRDIVGTKQQVYELISTAFMLRSSSIFAVCWLATNKLRALLTQQLFDLQAIVAAAPRVAGTSTRVESTTDLANAEAALLTLTAAFAARSSGVAGQIGPTVQRFSASIERFMRDELSKNVVVQGAIVKTPEELRVEVASRWASAKARHQDIDATVQGLIGALDSYTAVRLPDQVVGSLLGRIQKRLAALTVQMEASSAAQDSRNALLEFSAMRVLLQQASRFRVPVLVRAPVTGDPRTGEFTGSVGVPASVLGEVSGPFRYAPGTQIDYAVGSTPGSLVLPEEGATADELVQAFAVDGRLQVTVEKRQWESFTGRRSLELSSENVLEHHVVVAADLIADGTATVRAGADLEALGVEAGMVLVTSAPVAAQRVLLEVQGPVLVLSEALPAGTYSYFIGVDYSAAPAGLLVQVTGQSLQDIGSADLEDVDYIVGNLTQTYRTLAGGPGELVLDAPLAVATGEVHVSQELLRIGLRTVAPGLTLAIQSGLGATALGLPTHVAKPHLRAFNTGIDLSARGVEAGDVVHLFYGANTEELSEIASVEGAIANLKDALPHQEGAIRYEVRSSAVEDYMILRRDLRNVIAEDGYAKQGDLDLALGRLQRGARFLGSVQSAVTGYVAALLELANRCDAYVVPRDETVEQAMRVMAEHGFDRAADMFVALRLAEFFALDADGVSYRTWVVRTSATVMREVLPVSKDGNFLSWDIESVTPTTYDPSSARSQR